MRLASASSLRPDTVQETILMNRLERHRLPVPMREVMLVPGRKYRFDFVWPDWRIAVELHGGVWVAGAHVRGEHFESDCEKSALAQILGYMVLAVTPGMVESGRAIPLIEQALAARGWRR